MFHKNLSFCFIVLLFIIFTVGANAFNLNLDEIVVTGTRTERKIIDVPIRTEIISLADIKSKHAFNLYETLEGVPGLRVEQQCSNCNFTLLRMGGMSGGYTSILLDGQPLLSALAQVYSLQQIGTADIERIEVVKGTGSALYGAEALAGVINIIYREPTVTPVSNFRITLGSHGLRDYSAFSSVRRGDYGISLSVQKTLKNAIDENNDYFTDRVESDNLNAGLRLYSFNTFKENDKLVFSGKAYREFRRGGNLEDNAWEDPLDDDAEHISTRRYEGGINYKAFYDNNIWIESNLTLSNHWRNATNGAAWELLQTKVEEFGYGYADDDGIHGVVFYDTIPGGFTHDTIAQIIDWRARPYISDENMLFSNFTLGFKAGDNHSLITGMQYKTEEIYQSINLESSVNKSKDFAIYLQDEWRITDRLEAVIGGRFDKHKSEDNTADADDYNENAFNPRIALKHNYSDNLRFRFNFGTGFKVPTLFAEDMHLCASSPKIKKDNNLKSEKATSYMIGSEYSKERLNFNANLYYTLIKDKVYFTDEDAPDGFDFIWTNAEDNAKVISTEFDITYQLNPNLLVKADLNLTSAKYDETTVEGEKDGKNIRRTPQYTAGASMQYIKNGWDWILSADLTGPMYIDLNWEEAGFDPADYNEKVVQKTDAFSIWNFKVAKTFENKNSTIFAGVKNLFDEVQKDRSHKYDGIPGYEKIQAAAADAAFIYKPLTGREIYTGLEITF